MKCKICGRTGQLHILGINLSGGNPRNDVCQACQLKESLRDFKSLEDLEMFEARYLSLEKSTKEIIQAMPEALQAPKGLEGLALTPMSVFKHIQEVLAEIKVRRMELLTDEDSEFRLNYLLKKAIEEEDFEQADKLQRQLDDLKK